MEIGAAGGARAAMSSPLGTGIGGGVVAGGKLQQGAHGFAGEYGHMVVDRTVLHARVVVEDAGALCV